MGQNKVTFGTGEVDITHHNEIKYGTEKGHFLGLEKLTYGHSKTNFGIERGDFLGQEKLILGLFKMDYGT
jgi:hypothetical protein